MADDLVRKGYVERRPNPDDARSKILHLTARGLACTRAATAAADETLRPWAAGLTAAELDALRAALSRLATPGRIRPTW